MRCLVVLIASCILAEGALFGQLISPSEEDPVAKILYKDFASAGKEILNLKELRPKRPDDPWQCDIASAVKGDDPTVFEGELIVDTAFSGRQVRVTLKGKERKEIDGTYGLSTSEASRGLVGSSTKEVVSQGTEKHTVVTGHRFKDGYDQRKHVEKYEDAAGSAYELSFWEEVTAERTIPIATVRAGTICLRKLGQEIIIEVAAQYTKVSGEKVRDVKGKSSQTLSNHEVDLRKQGLPSQCFRDVKVEWMITCS